MEAFTGAYGGISYRPIGSSIIDVEQPKQVIFSVLDDHENWDNNVVPDSNPSPTHGNQDELLESQGSPLTLYDDISAPPGTHNKNMSFQFDASHTSTRGFDNNDGLDDLQIAPTMEQSLCDGRLSTTQRSLMSSLENEGRQTTVIGDTNQIMASTEQRSTSAESDECDDDGDDKEETKEDDDDENVEEEEAKKHYVHDVPAQRYHEHTCSQYDVYQINPNNKKGNKAEPMIIVDDEIVMAFGSFVHHRLTFQANKKKRKCRLLLDFNAFDPEWRARLSRKPAKYSSYFVYQVECVDPNNHSKLKCLASGSCATGEVERSKSFKIHVGCTQLIVTIIPTCKPMAVRGDKKPKAIWRGTTLKLDILTKGEDNRYTQKLLETLCKRYKLVNKKLS